MKTTIRFTTAAVAVAAALTMASTAFGTSYDPTKDFGSPGDANSVQRVITISSQTKWLNVGKGEDVKIVDAATGQSFVWDFNTPNTNFDLGKIAPAGMLNQHVTAYVRQPIVSD